MEREEVGNGQGGVGRNEGEGGGGGKKGKGKMEWKMGGEIWRKGKVEWVERVWGERKKKNGRVGKLLKRGAVWGW